jgi:formyl-CoA transferase
MSMADIFADPHFRARNMIVDVPDETLGALPQPGVVPKLSKTPGEIRSLGPTLGNGNDAVYRDRLGLGDEQGPWAVLDEEGALLAVYERTGDGRVKPAVVLAPA